jgi:hypothetical protein
MDELDKAELVAQQTRDMIEETRRERADLIELIRTSRETIERSHAQIKRLDVVLAAAENPKR